MREKVTKEQRAGFLGYYDATMTRWLEPAVRAVSDEPAEVLGAARGVFESMLDSLPYIDRPRHTMASSMFACSVMLAVYEVLRTRNVDAHAWGRAIHTLTPSVAAADEAGRKRAAADGRSSMEGAAANEFVFEIVESDEHGDRGMNITSCAICHLFGQYDAMDLVPYMCSFDDVVSDAGKQGLRRSGTLALGASRCDFRFRPEGEPRRLAEQYPDHIRLQPDPRPVGTED